MYVYIALWVAIEKEKKKRLERFVRVYIYVYGGGGLNKAREGFVMLLTGGYYTRIKQLRGLREQYT